MRMTFSMVSPATALRQAAIFLGVVGLSLSGAQATQLQPLDLTIFPDDWTVAIGSSGTVVEVSTFNDVDYLRIGRPPDAGGVGAIAFWDGNTEFENGFFPIGYTGSVVLRPAATGVIPFGVVVGAENKTYNNNVNTNNRGFYLATNVTAGLGIWFNTLNTTTETASNTILGEESSTWSAFDSGLSADVDYLLEFSVIGPALAASLWEMDSSGNKLGNALGSVSYTHTENITGFFGLKAGRIGNTRSGYFRDVDLTVIPEPGLSGVIITALVALGLARRRRHY